MRYLKILLYLFLTPAFISCEEEAGNSFLLDFDGTKTGAYLRQISPTSTFSRSNISGSSYGVTLEAYAGALGDEFTSIDLYVKFDGATKSKSEVLVKNITKEQFTRNTTSKLLRTEVTVTAAEAMTLLGLSQADLSKDDIFQFRQSINLPDGRSYSANNSNSVLSQPFYNSPFINDITVSD